MSNTEEPEIIHVDITGDIPQKNRPDKVTIIRHLLYFVITFISVASMGGIFFVGHTAEAESLADLIFWEGILFAALLLGFLAVHEFGHYFAAVYHNVNTSLPYFIPLPFISPIGTIGAVIKIKEQITDTIKLYDIGISGPLAGFVVALGVLIFGFATLPEPDFLANFDQHDEVVAYVQEHGSFPDEALVPDGAEVIMFGETLLYTFLASFFDNAPPMWEMYHYPFLLAGWLGLFFTALNLMPVGQLDGGHILYSLIGFKRHQFVARLFFGLVVTLAGFAAVPLLQSLSDRFMPDGLSLGWLLWAMISFSLFRKAFYGHQVWTLAVWLSSLVVVTLVFLLTAGSNFGSGYGVWIMFTLFILYFVKIEHPPVYFEKKLDRRRKILGWATMFIFILCISPTPIYVQ
ncbi:MAG: site-2 protease family protein [Balneolia bacterium]|nr:site-2 protease family protein [Balneolia bacterium]